MADNKKIYSIQINGVQESVDAVDSLNKQLNALDSKIKELSNKTITVSSKGGSSSVLSEEAALQREINNLKNEGAKLDAKIVATQSEVYQKVQATKDLYKEAVNDQKQLAAQERLTANAYSNTMAGMKQHLADLKSVINTTDLGDSDGIKKMTQEANELTNKLKEMEEAYGQFGRNVGNYANGVAEGLQKVKINVGGTVREFSSAREASKVLNNELKAMAINGDTTSAEFKQLREAVMQMESATNDAKKPMDDLMDAMESFTAVASASQGLSAFFGFDDSEIQKSMQRLLALQTALKGIQTLNKQLQTREGFGKWVAPFTTSIDAGTKKLLVYNRALLGTGTASKVAATSVKLFGAALKLAISGGILLVIDLLIEGLMKLVDSFKKVDEEAEREKAVQKDLANAYGNAKSKLLEYKTTVDNFNGSKKQEKKLVEELNREFGSTLGTYKSLAEWQDVLKQKGDAYIQTLVNQAKVQAALNEVTAAYMNLEDVKQKAANGEYKHFWQTKAGDKRRAATAIKKANDRVAKSEENLQKVVKENNEYAKKNGVGSYAPNFDKTTKSAKDTADKALKARIDAMEEGYQKELALLDYQEKQELKGLKKGSEAYLAVQEKYKKKRLELTEDYKKRTISAYTSMWDEIHKIQRQNENLADENANNELDAYVAKRRNEISNANATPTIIQRDVKIDENGKLLVQSEEQYTKALQTQLKVRIEAINNFNAQVTEVEISAENERYERLVSGANRSMSGEIETYKSGFTKQEEAIKENLKKHLISEEQAKEALETLAEERERGIREIEKKYRLESEKNAKEHEQNLKDITASGTSQIIEELQKQLNAASSLQVTPQKNSLGFISVKKTKEEAERIKEIYRSLIQSVETQITAINTKLQRTDLTETERKQLEEQKEQLESMKQQIGEGIKATEDGVKEAKEKWKEQLQDMLQGIGDVATNMLQMISTLATASIQAEIDQLDKEIDAVKERYDEMDALAQEHANNMEQLESQIAQAQGSAREHLIQRYLAEKEAQKEALKQKKQAEKEEEKLLKRKEDLEKEQREKQKAYSLAQALINTSLSITFAAMNTWPTPALPMMAAAAAAGAAQIAAISSQKLANGGQLDGGVAVGNRHRDGGIKVLGGRAEIEGGEYVTNRITTENNVDLLDFINSKKRKVDISDLIAFYSKQSNVKRVISDSSPSNRFADGGQIPSLQYVDTNSALISTIERYANRPTYVAVTEIEDAQARVNYVRALAGLEPSKN